MIAYIRGTSLIDYPGKIASVVFVAGCNFRCPFCQNVELVLPEKIKEINFIEIEEAVKQLEDKKKLIDGVCITGGEPTTWPGLEEFVKKLKEKGLLVKLDTNGYLPDVLENLLKNSLLDYISMDIKSSPEKYEKASGIKINLDLIRRSVELIKKMAPDYEFRTTAVPPFLEEEDIIKIGKFLGKVKRYAIQHFNTEKTLDPNFPKKPYSEEHLLKLKEMAKEWAQEVILR